ncbi:MULTISPECIES: TipJ family phage tail tip protein [unclassified Psychrobacter]|uniref:TipJ family phage tail tip protein n=1 Tax=unclassified Psychrobacter TaxID=196806 RepID=UPI00086D42F1|nr:phage tail protein [Psychrobacter sp. B29-1]OEH68517.1 MAG: hypothetical protein BAX61_07135 [Psychrobacter sp. B29-1]
MDGIKYTGGYLKQGGDYGNYGADLNPVTIKGAKAGQDKPRKPSIAKDSVASTSTAKLLYGLAEGEVWGLVDGGKSIRLDGTPLLDDAGNSNFDGVTWDFRHGTNEQDYIKGFPDVANETPINVELRSTQPWIKAFTDTQLSAVRIRFKWNRLSKTDPENGDVSGHKIDYAIDLQTDGGVYQNVLTTKIEDKTSAGYERTHRIDLPKSKTGWQIRVRRITPNDSNEYIQDTMLIDAVAEVIDVKLRYPNTALLGLQYNAETFSSIAKLEAHVRGSIIRVPANYDPVARTYAGIWDGTFKDAYSNNPAWVYFDLCTQWRYGLGDRLDITMIDKWTLYALGQYCDQMVSDGKGGLEPRFACNVYLQKQVDAYQVLQNIGGIFRAMSYWNGERIVLDADVPQDPVYTFSRANVIDGNFEYTGTRARDRHTLAKVAYDNPLNRFETEYEYIRDEKAMAKFGVKVLDLSAFGCTSQAQAQRAGLWALKTEQLETRQVSFGVGLDGFIPQVGNIINVSDELFAGRANGGRVSAVSDAQYVVTLDRDVVANAGDVLIVNGGGGQSERRTIKSVAGRKITLNAAFTAAEKENVWAIETADLKLMRFRVMTSKKNDDTTFAIIAIQHEPQKFPAIDFGTDVKPTDITIVNPDVVDAPANVTITSRHRVVQGQTIATLVISWAQVKDAVAYDVEWRKDDGSWVKVPRTGNVSVEIEGVYSGNYLARVRSVSAFDVQSQPTTSMLTAVKGKIGLPPKILGLTATGVLFGMELKWGFGTGSGDSAYTEIETGSAPNTNVKLLGQYSYPTNTHTVTGLQGNLSQSYRARLVDKLGFKSDWSDWVTGTTDASADKILDLLDGQITESQLYKDLGDKIDKIEVNETEITRVDEVTKSNTESIAESKTELTASFNAAIDNIQIGGRNLIANSDFSQGYATIRSSVTQSESTLGKVTKATSTTAESSFVVTQPVALRTTKIYAGKTYTLSFFGQATFNNLNYVYIFSASNPTFRLPAIPIDSILSTKHSITFTAPYTTDDAAIAMGAIGYPAGAWFAFGGLKLEEGNKATAWTPAPEDITAAIQRVETASANATGAVASSVSTLQTTVNGHTSSIQTQQQSLNGLYAQYTVKIDVGGRVSGFGLASSATSSDFAIRADKFYIAPPEGSSKGSSPFIVLTTPQVIDGVTVPVGTYMRSAYIHNGSIDTAKIKDAAIKTAQIDSLAVKSGNIDNLAVTTGKIADLSVETLKIKDNAVTIASLFFAEQTDTLNIAQTEREIAGVTLNPEGGSVAISFGFEYMKVYAYGLQTGATLVLKLKRDNVVLRTIEFTAGRNSSSDVAKYNSSIIEKYVTFATLLDSPPNGNRRYSVTASTINTNESEINLDIKARSLMVNGAKK